MKKIFSPAQKAQVAIEAIKGIKTINQIGSHYEVHPTQIGHWRKTVLERASELFTDKRAKEHRDEAELNDRLYKLIGQRDIEIDWLKKKLHFDT